MKPDRPILYILAIVALSACSRDHAETASQKSPRLGGVPVAEAAMPRRRAPGERLWIPGGSREAYDASPDGRFIGYIDWDSGNLMVHDLQTNADRDLTKKGSYKDSDDEAETALFSPDGQRIAYEWWDSKTRNDEIRLINSDGSGVRTIYHEEKVNVWPEDWSADGRNILTILEKEGVRSMALVPVDGGAPRILKAVTDRSTVGRLSPDGRQLAYTDVRRDIFVMSLDGGKETAVVTNPADDEPVGWTPDGTRLIFSSDRGGSPGLWSQRITGGRADGAPTLVRGDLWRMLPIRLTRQGRFFYTVASGDRDVFVAALDPETGRLQSPPVPITGRPGEFYYGPQWSPDGKYVAYFMSEVTGVRHTRLFIRSVGGTEVREFLPQIHRPRALGWVPSSQLMVINGTDSAGRSALYRFDLKTGETTPLVSNTFSITAFSPDGRTMYYIPRVMTIDTASRLMARDLATGKERLLYTERRGGRINANAVTPDGRWVIVVWAARAGAPSIHPVGTFAISTETGEMRNLGASIPFDSARQTQRHVGFTPDNKSVLIMLQRTDSAESFALWRAPIAGGAAVRLPAAPADFQQVNQAGSWLSPDGRRFVYAKGQQLREIWAFDLPR